MTPTYCIQCEKGYFFDVSQSACLKKPLMSEEGMATLVTIGVTLGVGFMIMGVYKLLERF